MTKAITHLNCVPLRAAASHRSEMISQILFGEPLEVQEIEGDFSKIRMVDTEYEGWVQSSQISIVENWLKTDHIVGLDTVDVSDSGDSFKLCVTTKVSFDTFTVGKREVKVKGKLRKATIEDFEREFPLIIDYYMRAPYMWGGRTVSGIDCSGLSQAVYAYFGVPLLRDAYQQAEQGEVVNFLTNIKPGDLAFFDNAEGRITHVGIMVTSSTILHASGEVRIDLMDQEGIFNKEYNRYTHKLRIIKRYF